MSPDPTLARDPGRPHYLRRSLRVLAFVTLAVFALVKAKAVLVPLAFAAVAAMLMQGPVAKLSAYVPRAVAIGVSALAMFAIVAAVFFAAGQQVADFAADLPRIEREARQLVGQARSWVSTQFGISAEAIERRVAEGSQGLGASVLSRARVFTGGVFGFLGDLLLFFVYYVLLLAEQSRLRRFVLAKAPRGAGAAAEDTLDSVQSVAGEYIRGRGLLVAILFGVYAAGFSFAGLEYALVVAAVAALMSVVPYVGNLAAAALVTVVAALSGDFANTILIALGTMAVAQVLESYVLTPLIVGKGVELNALTTILAVIGFGAIWGLPGAILGLPIVAIVRQVLLHVPDGKAWAYVMGDLEPSDDGLSVRE